VEEEIKREAEVLMTEKVTEQAVELPSVAEQSEIVFGMVEKLATRLMQPWSAYQIA